jgi:radical SAM protein with 4Fe4S-binding SPASM domain
MSDKGIDFLTEKSIDHTLLVKTLQNQISLIKNPQNKTILNQIIKNFLKNDFSILSPQELHYLNSHSFDIWSEYLIFRYKFKYFPTNHIVSDFPNYVLIEPVSSCNLRCIMCFQIDETFNKSGKFMGIMDFELFKKVIDQAYVGGTNAITLASRGEPTLHPKLGDMLEYCKDKFFELKINTNATKLNEKLIHKILKSGVTDVVFSVDSYQKNEYESIRVKGIFENVLNNIKLFQRIRKEHYPNSKCATRISGVKVTKEQDPIQFKKFWEQYVDHVVMIEMENRWDTYHNPKEIAGTTPCDYLWERLYVWFDGICNPCDVDYKSELSVGSIHKNSLGEIWNGSKFNEIRKKHVNGNRHTCYPCDRCPIGS